MKPVDANSVATRFLITAMVPAVYAVAAALLGGVARMAEVAREIVTCSARTPRWRSTACFPPRPRTS
ncbi:hypothetical protein [Streptomyces deccanensis]|uniref:hypothetical protein n=1 Tax=Streptomyces deccanensis TaxID=424188 RepID=UPI001EFB5B2E|nr:hypothetical protein [Streptomyces deccanensis]ULR48962.1 hypothetical protein L3078_06550 [Streptomyces deccanensis]